MVLKTKWTRRALNAYTSILQYIQNSFGEVSAKEYAKRVNDLIELLQSFPDMGTVQNQQEKLRGIILYRRTTILYRDDDKVLFILNVIDHRINK